MCLPVPVQEMARHSCAVKKLPLTMAATHVHVMVDCGIAQLINALQSALHMEILIIQHLMV